jgi:hypothetical protein
VVGQGPQWHPSYAASIEVDRGTYYRLKVKLAYKGEPQDFDIVVGCNVVQTHYQFGGTSYEVGLVPTLFGRRMSDGKALVIRSPRACRGETSANGKVPSDLLPLVIIYDDPDTLSFGIAYVSEDAYESPLSVLNFGGATIETATRAEFNEFRHAQKNLVSRELYHSALDSDQLLEELKLTRVARSWAHECQGYARFRNPEEARTMVRENWPKTHPRYWTTDTWEAERALANEIVPYRQSHPDADYGMPTRAGGGRVGSTPGIGKWHIYPATYYPAARTDYLISVWPANPADRAAYVAAHKSLSDMDIDFRSGQTKGFAYCAVTDGLSWPRDRDLIETIDGKRAVARVDGQDIPWTGQTHVVGNPSLATPGWIFESDDYAFQLFYIYLESTRGDV